MIENGASTLTNRGQVIMTNAGWTAPYSSILAENGAATLTEVGRVIKTDFGWTAPYSWEVGHQNRYRVDSTVAGAGHQD